MADVTPFIPWALGIVTLLTSWLLKQVTQHGNEIASLKRNSTEGERLAKLVSEAGLDIRELKTAFRYYLERTSMDSAKILAGSSNPTPPAMAELLRRYPNELDDQEKETLRRWLETVMNNRELPKGERSIALQLLAAMDTMKRLITTHHTQDRGSDGG